MTQYHEGLNQTNTLKRYCSTQEDAKVIYDAYKNEYKLGSTGQQSVRDYPRILFFEATSKCWLLMQDCWITDNPTKTLFK